MKPTWRGIGVVLAVAQMAWADPIGPTFNPKRDASLLWGKGEPLVLVVSVGPFPELVSRPYKALDLRAPDMVRTEIPLSFPDPDILPTILQKMAGAPVATELVVAASDNHQRL